MGRTLFNETHAVVWDSDGTLARDTLYKYWFPAVHNIAQKHGLIVPEIKMANHLAHDPYAAPQYGLAADQAAAFGNEVRAEALRLAQENPLRPSLTLVRLLKVFQEAGIRQGVATSANKPWALAILQNMGLLEGVFDRIITRDDVPDGETKPRPTQLNMILEHVGIGPENAAMIGDSPSDIGAGAAANFDKNIYYHPEGHQYFHDITPDFSIKLESLATHKARSLGEVRRAVLNGQLR